MNVVTCTNHCGSCSRHFSSVAAFDAHRVRDESGWPQCFDPEFDVECYDAMGVSRFIALSIEGECRMYAEVERGVTVWALARDVLRARERFSGLGGNALRRSGTPRCEIVGRTPNMEAA